MKYRRRIAIALLALLLGVTLAGTVSAQMSVSDQVPEVIELHHVFNWATGEDGNWRAGVLYAALGLVGALVTVFSLIGGAVPGTAGFGRIEAGLKRVEEREKLLDKLLQQPERDAGEIKAVERAVNNLRDDVSTQRRQQFILAGGLYLILGAFFAMLLANDLLQALVIGAGWTAYLGALGLKKDYAERKSVKDRITEKLEAALPAAEVKGGADPWRDLRMEVAVSKAL